MQDTQAKRTEQERDMYQETLEIATRGRGTYSITAELQKVVQKSGVETGLCHLFVQHTSASLVICENADPDVRSDLEGWMQRQVPDGDPAYAHSMEGADDMPAHIRSILTNMDLTIPVTAGSAALGIWQGVFLYEHRYQPHRRRVIVTVKD
jgi:secondary thiamine-phosphate synthase enzyme